MRIQNTVFAHGKKKVLFSVIFICILLSLRNAYPSWVVQFNTRAEFGSILPVLPSKQGSSPLTVGKGLSPNSTGVNRDSLSNRPHEKPVLKSDFLLDRFIVVPEYKLLFCYVEKVGCAMFNHLFRMLRLLHGLHPKEAAFQAQALWWRNTPEVHGLNKADLERLLADANWTKAVFYRDPLTRFLSAFRNKCTGKEGDRYCLNAFGKSKLTFTEAIARIQNGTVLGSDAHFSPASHFCGGLMLDYYDMVHELTPESIPHHVRTLFQQIGVDSNTTESLIDSVVRSGGTNHKEDKRLVARLNVRLNFEVEQTKQHFTNSTTNVCRFFDTKDKLDTIQNLYKVDYETFELPPKDLGCRSL